jgi:hypothetical protein
MFIFLRLYITGSSVLHTSCGSHGVDWMNGVDGVDWMDSSNLDT